MHDAVAPRRKTRDHKPGRKFLSTPKFYRDENRTNHTLEKDRSFRFQSSNYMAVRVSGVFTCSGRKPTPTTRAGIRRKIGQRRINLRGHGRAKALELPRTFRITLFCIAICSRCVAQVGKLLRRWTARSSLSEGVLRRSIAPSRFAFATAS